MFRSLTIALVLTASAAFAAEPPATTGTADQIFAARCAVCHDELGFKMRAGSNEVTMKDIVDGKFCGSCHNGDIAWSPDRCDLCHSGKPGLKSGIYGGHHSTGPGYW